MNNSIQSLGGKATAAKLRTLALEKYYENPTLCKYCGAIIVVKEEEKISEVKKRKYCNQICNGMSKKIKDEYSHLIDKNERCKRRNGIVDRDSYESGISILNKTKGDLFSDRANWQSARSSIQRSARNNYFDHFYSARCCKIGCDYSLHIDVAHIKPVSEFDDSVSIATINNPENLVGLCKNHHWELDNGYLLLNDIDLSNR
jgi:hypothetical protein